MLYIDANPEKKEQNAETHEHGRNEGNKQFLENVTCELSRSYLVAMWMHELKNTTCSSNTRM